MRKTVQVSESVKEEIKKLQDLYGIKSESELIAFLILAHQEKELTALQHMGIRKEAKELNKREGVQLKLWSMRGKQK